MKTLVLGKAARLRRRLVFIFFVCLGLVFQAAAITKEDIIPPLRPPHLQLPPTFYESHRWQIGLAAAGLFVFLMALVVALTRKRLIPVEAPVLVARRNLAALRGAAENVALVVAVSDLLKKYLRITFGFPTVEMTTTEFCQTLKSVQGIDSELGESLCAFFRQCDEWKFALPSPMPQPGPVDRAIDLVNRVEFSRRQATSSQP